MNTEAIIQYVRQGKLRWTAHITARLFQRGVSTEDIERALSMCEIVEQYPDDYPYPSCLALGYTPQPLHVVCGDSGTELWLITAYRPDPQEWQEDNRTRKERA